MKTRYRNKFAKIFSFLVLVLITASWGGSEYELAQRLVMESKALDFSEYVESTLESLISKHPEMEEHREMLYNVANDFLYSKRYTEAKIGFLTSQFTEQELKDLLLILENDRSVENTELMKKYKEMKSLIQNEIVKHMELIVKRYSNPKDK